MGLIAKPDVMDESPFHSLECCMGVVLDLFPLLTAMIHEEFQALDCH